jgi:type IX secretion system PorP/SprF family membrane protein
MIRFLFSILTILCPVHLLGQMVPLSDHYINNALAINPAFAGCHDAMSATIFYRNQWVGFDDAPKSQMLSVHTPIDNDRIGLGLLVERNSIGIFNKTNLIGNYAYRMELLDGKLALGLGFGLTVYNSAWNELLAADANDVQLMTNNISGVVPAFSLGTYYYTSKYFIGISVPLFLSYDPDKSSGKYKIGKPFSGSNYFLTGGYEISISNNFKLQPSLLIKYHHGNAVQIDYNVMGNLKDRFWMGIGYRNKDMLVGMLQCQVNYQLRIAYSYDFEYGTHGKYMNGSHEIVLNYIFKYARKVIGPRQF